MEKNIKNTGNQHLSSYVCQKHSYLNPAIAQKNGILHICYKMIFFAFFIIRSLSLSHEKVVEFGVFCINMNMLREIDKRLQNADT